MLHWKSLKKYTFPPNETQKMVLAWLFQGLEPFLDHKKPWIHTHTPPNTQMQRLYLPKHSPDKKKGDPFSLREITTGKESVEKKCLRKSLWDGNRRRTKEWCWIFLFLFLLSLTLTSCSAIVLHKWAPKTEMGKKTQGRFCAHRPRGLERGRMESWHPVMQPLVF